MSTAHRPTWDPAQGREVKGGSRQYSTRDMASQTKLKFRQPGQTSSAEVKKRDLRAELLQAEAEARDRKRKAEGKPPLEPSPAGQLAITAGADEESNKRRKVLQEVADLDRDDDEDANHTAKAKDKGKAKDENRANGEAMDVDDDDDEDEDDDDDDEEDDTDELLRELEKIKRERAEEKERQEREESAKSAEARAEEIAAGNPLLNLAAALGQQTPGEAPNSVGGSFAVKKRWDDDLVFKNQAVEQKRPSHFVNDLLRTEFHKKFMSKFIK